MKILKDELAADLKSIYHSTNKPPTKREYKKMGKYGVNTIVRTWGTWNKAILEVTGKVGRPHDPVLPIQCPLCLEKFVPLQKGQIFCSRSCSNKSKPRRKLTKKCRACGSSIRAGYTFCSHCKSVGRHLRGGNWLAEKTLKEVIYKSGSNKYGVVRGHAKNVVRDRKQACGACGYSKHVEVCHKKSIPSFSLETKIKEINSKENLILLCPNHHWELHHGLLKL